MRGAVKMSHKGIGDDQDVSKSEQPVFSVVRLVGWTYGIQDVSKAKKDAVQAFQALADDGDLSSLRNLLVIWDGDRYAPNSFTEILGHLASILPPSVRFVSHYFSTEAPCSQYEHDRMTGFNFESIGSINFSEALPPIENLARCTLVPIPQLPDQTYLDLALAALQWVQGSAKARTLRVLCFGGGQTVRDEMQRVRSGILPELEITYVQILNGQSRINRQGELEAAPVEPVE
mmetsp:Transcript_9308/g.18342  ORF Transcript_9308/g.18342 Transcript_9308/m.18342 type:complete len:232 (+) Transcript_9308:272-967(+)